MSRLNMWNRGSAYLVVLATIVVAMFLLMASMERSVDSSKKTFSIENHIITNNCLNSCAVYIFHQIKTWPFDKRSEFILPKNQVAIEDTTCKIRPLEADLRNFSFELQASYKDISKSSQLVIIGKESYKGIQWDYFIQ
tara:strand:+ start:222 stop:635 length:414 start_codon:yes stop_codon:yes gene_type:complete